MRVRQRIPGYIDTPWWEGDVDDLTGLLALDFVVRWSEQPGFKRWSVSPKEHDGDVCRLMAEFDNEKFWVVALIWADDLDLPRWEKRNG